MKFRKKPIVIEAVRWDGSPESMREILAKLSTSLVTQIQDSSLVIGTLEGDMNANLGDWIIKGVAGEIYPCKPDIFAVTYEEVNDSQD